MKSFSWRRFLSSRYFLAVFAGLLMAASFPKIGIAGFAWVAPGLMAFAGFGKPGWERFRIGYVAGLAHYLTALYWLLWIPYRWHGVPLGPALGWMALSAFMALFVAAWVWFVAPGTDRPELQPGSAFRQLALRSWVERALWALAGAVAWVAMEMVVARVLSGFPWTLLGSTQYQLVPLIQIASVTGVYGVSWLLTWVALGLILAGIKIGVVPTGKSAWVSEMVLPLLFVAVVFNLGFRSLRTAQTSDRFARVTLIQPSIPQTLIWDEANDDTRFSELIALSEQGLTNETDLLVWPEAAVPKLLRYDRETFEQITGLARRHKIWMIVGADDAEPGQPGPDGKRRATYYNSSFLINPEGKLVERYRKRALVVFGEYIPLLHWFPFLKYFTPIEGGFQPGDRAVPFILQDPDVKTSVLICFEDIFPHLAREYAFEDTDFLVNLTNNGWFDETAAQWQHGISALFRAVENGLPLIRCANNGLTCWVDGQGRLREVLHDAQGTIYGRGVLSVRVPLRPPGHVPTFYTRHGDVFGWGCVVITGFLLLARIVSGRRTRKDS